MRNLQTLLILAGLAALCAPGLTAANWAEHTAAVKNSDKTGKPVFVLVIHEGRDSRDTSQGTLGKKADKDADAKAFILATLNLHELAKSVPGAARRAYQSSRNEELQRVYGRPGTCVVFAPGGVRPIWSLENGASQEDVFAQAAKGYENWRAPINALEKEMKDDRELRKDPDTLEKLAELWATGFAVSRAVAILEEATKLVRKKSPRDSRIEKWALRIADISYDGRHFTEAAQRYRDFGKAFSESPDRFKARLGVAKSLLASDDKAGALKAVAEIGEDAPAEIAEAAKKVAEEASKPAED